MLRIKQEVKLEELEKIGFTKLEHNSIIKIDFTEYYKDGISVYGDDLPKRNDLFFPRKILVKSFSNKTISLLFKLIQLGYIEEVDDERDNSIK